MTLQMPTMVWLCCAGGIIGDDLAGMIWGQLMLLDTKLDVMWSTYIIVGLGPVGGAIEGATHHGHQSDRRCCDRRTQGSAHHQAGALPACEPWTLGPLPRTQSSPLHSSTMRFRSAGTKGGVRWAALRNRWARSN